MSRRRPSFRASLVALPLLTLIAGGCAGGDDMTDDASPGGASTSGDSSTTTSTSSAPGKGTGTVSIGGTEFAFTAEPCRIDGGEQATVEAEGEGTADGKPFTVVVKRSPSKTSVVENFQLVFSASESFVGSNFVTLPGGADTSRIEVEGEGRATGTFAFLGTGGRPSGEGTFRLTCEG